jgi:hypothetical protein
MRAMAAALLMGASGAAMAADLPTRKEATAPVVETQGCDFFEAELIGYLCGKTAFISVGGDAYTLTNKFNVTAPGFSLSRKSVSQQAEEGAALAVTPIDGLRITLGDEAFQYRNTLTQQVVQTVFPNQAFQQTLSGAQNGWASASVEYTLWDKHNDYGRFITNLVGYVETFAGGGPYQMRDLQQIGWSSSYKYAFGASGYSLNYFGNTLFQRIDNPGETRVSSYSRLLLANDVWGVAAGPRLATTTELWHAAGVNTGWSDARLGGEVLLEPFRMTKIAYLKDVTIDAYAVHTIGQASLIPTWLGKASAYDYGGAARFNFRF